MYIYILDSDSEVQRLKPIQSPGTDPGFFNGGWLIQSATKLFGTYAYISFFFT